MITRIPKVIAVQARQCAPIWAVFQYGASGLDWVTEGETIAEGVRIRYPLRGDQVVNLLNATDGDVVVTDEQEILPGQAALAGLGFYVEPTSAIVWNAINQVVGKAPEPIVAILTGTGLKTG